MAIKRRELLPDNSSFNYEIKTQHFTAGIYVNAKTGRIDHAAPQLHWTIGKRYDYVRDTCSARVWTLTKIEKNKS